MRYLLKFMLVENDHLYENIVTMEENCLIESAVVSPAILCESVSKYTASDCNLAN
jgi:hypothetical protein